MLNENYLRLQDSYLFYRISQRKAAYLAAHPGARLLDLGIGDVSLPLAPAVIAAMHAAVDEQARRESFHGYPPELGLDFMKAAVAAYDRRFGVALDPDEIFISSGAGDDLGAIGDLFAGDVPVAVAEPAYPAYVDTNLMAGREIRRLEGNWDNRFLPRPPEASGAVLAYLCSPNNPTGAAYPRRELQRWVDWANETGSVLIFDAAYEAFITDPDVPHSIFELPGAKECAIEIASLSKTAGFTGVRCGYTVVPKALRREGRSLHAMWVRNRTTRTNGVSYIVQRGAAAALSAEGQRQNLENIAYYRENGRILAAALRRRGVPFTGGENAPYLWFRCFGGLNDWAFFDALLERTQLVGTPGVGFGPSGSGWFRFSCFGAREDAEAAAERLEAL